MWTRILNMRAQGPHALRAWVSKGQCIPEGQWAPKGQGSPRPMGQGPPLGSHRTTPCDLISNWHCDAPFGCGTARRHPWLWPRKATFADGTAKHRKAPSGCGTERQPSVASPQGTFGCGIARHLSAVAPHGTFGCDTAWHLCLWQDAIRPINDVKCLPML